MSFPSTRMARHWGVNSSMRLSIRYFRPSCVRSSTKSLGHTWLGRSARDGYRIRPDATLLGLFGGDLQPLAPPDPLDPLVVDDPADGRTQHLCDLRSCPALMDGLGLRRVWLGHHVSFRIRWAKDTRGPNGDGTGCRSFDELKDGHPRLAVRSEAQCANSGRSPTARRTGHIDRRCVKTSARFHTSLFRSSTGP